MYNEMYTQTSNGYQLLEYPYSPLITFTKNADKDEPHNYEYQKTHYEWEFHPGMVDKYNLNMSNVITKRIWSLFITSLSSEELDDVFGAHSLTFY